MIITTALTIALAASPAADSLAGDGNELLSACKQAIAPVQNNNEVSAQSGYCLGIVNGVGSTLIQLNDYLPKTQHTCFPRGIANVQSARIVVNYLQEHPDSRGYDGASLAMLALQKAFVCP